MWSIQDKNRAGPAAGAGGRSQVSVSSPPRWRWLGVRAAFPSVGVKGWEKNLPALTLLAPAPGGRGSPRGSRLGPRAKGWGRPPQGIGGVRGAELAQPLSLSLPLSLNCPRAGPALPLALQGSAHSSAHPCASLRTSPHPPRIHPASPRTSPARSAGSRGGQNRNRENNDDKIGFRQNVVEVRKLNVRLEHN